MTEQTEREALEVRLRKPLWMDQRTRHLHWTVYNGTVAAQIPMVLLPGEIDELEQIFGLLIKSLRRKAEQVTSKDAAP